MGYTHYWHIDEDLKEFPEEAINLIKDLVDDELIDQSDIDITNSFINFNGVGENAHENCFIKLPTKRQSYLLNDHKGKFFGFCKTARKPYDVIVMRVLLVLKFYLKDKMVISSDGSFNIEWRISIDEVSRLCGKTIYVEERLELGE
jgi:hypothetical protein